jgi:hypothetical protein
MSVGMPRQAKGIRTRRDFIENPKIVQSDVQKPRKDEVMQRAFAEGRPERSGDVARKLGLGCSSAMERWQRGTQFLGLGGINGGTGSGARAVEDNGARAMEERRWRLRMKRKRRRRGCTEESGR